MNDIFSDRISDVPRSFIREILKVTLDKSIISFAGGLPNRDLFPVEEIKEASLRIFEKDAKDALQYSTSEGYLPLREYIAGRYATRHNLKIDPAEILITSGSQQGLDLLGKVFLNDGDDIIIEEPGYLGAIQSFSVYRSVFHPVPVEEEGADLDVLSDILDSHAPKLFYTVPNFQNPSGITYSDENRAAVAKLIEGRSTLLIEDDPYGELRFIGSQKKSFRHHLPKNAVLLGSFSKTVVPSFRIGWIVAREDVMEKLIIAKQATDLHTNYFCQRIIYEYLKANNIDDHIELIKSVYLKQREAMVRAIKAHFPADVYHTEPEGGMFLWVSLPVNVSSVKLFNRAIEEKVAFVPGNPFYVNRHETNTLRLNFSCVDEKTIEEGIERLAKVIKEFV